MFTKTEEFYDALYTWKDYKAEAERLKVLLAANMEPSGRSFLDVACGTGGHISHLRDAFRIEGLDLNATMLEIAQRKHPDIQFHKGDMVDFDLGRQFDVVASLFSSIAYVKTPDRLLLAIANMAHHVRPGGILAVEPFFAPEAWKPQRPGPHVADQPNLTIVRMIDWAREGNIVTGTFHYLVGRASGVEHFMETHEMGLFTHEQYLTAFTAAGMVARHDGEGLMGRGLYMGTRPKD